MDEGAESSTNQTENEGTTALTEKTYLAEQRHKDIGKPDLAPKKIAKWRMRERMKTVSVALTYCLNIGVDPPDVIKTDPCARKECWMDPLLLSPQKALEGIGKALQAQYERWQSRARYKLSLDPTVDEVKKLCVSLRRNAKDERVLFHYNGHGVPKPTTNGEIWVFNKNYTQYIPLSIYELQSWMGSPSIYVFDCSGAGLIINWFLQFAEQREKEYERMVASSTTSAAVLPIKDYILLGACGVNELLPMNPELPADVFTSCLTTPIVMALQWFCSNSVLAKDRITYDMIDKIPGRLTDRRTPLGELNWIFTTITDTIAWNTLPRSTFQMLFRQDLLVASLFRNFLLAERIMRSLNCTPISFPKLPPTYQDPMWQAWDLAVDICLSQLPGLIEDPNLEYKSNPFFSEQLTAFEVWLEFGSEKKKPPEQLPVVLQVLLSQAHRLRALELLGKFLDLGSWAVNLALSVGIFPYVLKLLQSPAAELRKILVFIWTKVLALDKSCQLDLVKENGHNYFISVLASNISSDQRTMTAFILSVIANNCRPGQSACLNGGLLTICLTQLTHPDPLLRRWVVLCIAKLWESFEEAKWAAVKENALDDISKLLNDPVAEVRCAALYALGLFLGGSDNNDQRLNLEFNIVLSLLGSIDDGSVLVRKTLCEALGRLIQCYEQSFKEVAKEQMEEKARIEARDALMKKKFKGIRKKSLDTEFVPGSSPESGDEFGGIKPAGAHSTVFGAVWKVLEDQLSKDPFPEVAAIATKIVGSLSRSVGTDNNNNSPALHRSSSWTNVKSKSKIFSMQKKAGFNTLPRDTQIKKTASMDFANKADSDSEDEFRSNNNNEATYSYFYEWSCEYFTKPLMKKENQQLDTTDPAYIEKVWRQKRSELAVDQAMELYRSFDVKNAKVKPRFDEQVAILDNSPASASVVLLHAYEPVVVIADDRDGISVWDRETCQRINSFKNHSMQYYNYISRTNSMLFLNENSDNTLLMTGSDDGIVRVYSEFDEFLAKPKTVSAFNAFKPASYTLKSFAAMVMNWQQEHGYLLATGAHMPRSIRIWDLERELVVQDIASGLVGEACITSLASDVTGSRTIAAGCSDGSVRLFDQRSPPKYANIASSTEHKDIVIKVSIPKSDSRKIVSGSRLGEVKFWDLAADNSNNATNALNAFNKSAMAAMAVHDYAPVVACGSPNQKIKVYNFQGSELSLIRYHDGFLGQRIGPVSCLAFHPFSLLLAAGSTDSFISIYTRS